MPFNFFKKKTGEQEAPAATAPAATAPTAGGTTRASGRFRAPTPTKPVPAVDPDDPVAKLHASETWKKLENLLETHPLFKIVSFDGVYWIDPFLATKVSAPFDMRETVLRYFTENLHWKTSQLKSPIQLRALIWTGYLEDNLDTDQRFHKFAPSKAWINPYTKRPSPNITAEQSERRDYFIKRVSLEMAQHPEANPNTMANLEDLEIALGQRPPKPKAEPEQAGTRRQSGISGIESGMGMQSHAEAARRSTDHGSGVQAAAGPALPPGYIAVPAGAVPAVGAVPAGAVPAMAPSLTPVGGSTGMVVPGTATAVAAAQQHTGGFTPQMVSTAVFAAPPGPVMTVPPGMLPPLPVPEGLGAPIGTATYTQLEQLRAFAGHHTSSYVRGGIAGAMPVISLRPMDQPAPDGDEFGISATANRIPIVHHTELSQELISELVHSLQKISLAAGRLTVRPEDLLAPPAPAPVETDGLEPTEDVRSGDDATEPDPEAGNRQIIDSLATEALTNDESTKRRKAISEDDDRADDMSKAAKVQNHLLGGIPPLDGVEVAIEYIPYSHIGGDFYNIVKIDERRFFFIVGDVSGHGVQAALVVSSVINTLRIIFRTRQDHDLLEVICDLNDYMRECLMPGQFFTAFCGIMTIGATTVMESLCCGHHPSIRLNAQRAGEIQEIGKSSMGIGLVASATLRKQARIERTELSVGDVICMYTDGILEIVDENGEELGEALARASFQAHLEDPLPEMIGKVIKDIEAESDGVVADDQTILVIRVTEPPAALRQTVAEAEATSGPLPPDSSDDGLADLTLDLGLNDDDEDESIRPVVIKPD